MRYRHTVLLTVFALALCSCVVADDRIPMATLNGVPVDIEEVTSNEGEGSVTMTELASDPATPDAARWTAYFLATGLYYIDDAGAITGPLTTDHGGLSGLGDDDHLQYLLVSGLRALTGDWDAGSFGITAETFTSDVATGTAPLTVASTTAVANLNADLLDDQEGSYYLDSDNFSGTEWTDLTDSGATTLHTHDHGALDGNGDDDHTQYALLAGRSGGQALYGGTGASENLTLESTSNATKGHVVITGGKLTSADSTHTGTEMLGFNAVASGNDSVVIGQSADVGPNGVVIGQGAAGGDGAVVIGQGSGNGGTQDAVIIGLTATGTDGSIALGLSADATGGNVAIGSGAVADGAGSIAIGGAADAGHASAIAFGSSATTTAANQLVVEGITTAYLGDGVTDTSPSAMAVYATGGSGANIDGADLTIGGGASTGNGNGGRVFLSVTPPGASGSSANSYTTGLEIEADADGRFYQDLQIDGLTTATGLIDAVAGVFIDTTGQFQISNGTHQVEVYPSGTEMIVDSDGATMNTLKVSDLDVNVLTGDLTVTAGDATVTAGDVLVTAGGVGIRSGAPATLLHVDNGGTTPTLSSGTVALFQNTSAGNSLCSVSIAGGSATNGTSRLNFGTWWDEDNGYISYEMLSKAFTFRTNGSSSTKGTYDNSGNLTIPGDFQAGNSSNTRWANVPMIGGYITGAWSQDITTTNYRYSLAASNTGDILLDAPSSIHGSKIKAVRAYFQLSSASAGSLTANVAFYEPTGGSTGSATASSGGALFTTDISQTVTATAGTSATLAAGEQCLIRVWVSSNSSDGTFYLNSVEIQYEEREY